jgi:Amt family ammonium transporter
MMRSILAFFVPLVLVLILISAGIADAAEDTPQAAFNALDTVWVIVAAILVFFMQAGFGMVESGLVRSKNAGNVLMKNLLDFCFASLGYFMFGYAIMFGGGGLIIGTQGWFLVGAESAAAGVPVEAFWLFQAVFAGAAATIVAGAMAERMRFAAYLVAQSHRGTQSATGYDRRVHSVVWLVWFQCRLDPGGC